MNRQAEVLIVGAGPAGISAAVAAASCGRRVVVLDENSAPGGQIWRPATTHAPRGEQDPARQRSVEALERCGAELLFDRRVIDVPGPQMLRTIHEIDGAWRTENFAWEKLVLATGARERFLPFPGWTLPGVFGAGGLQALAKNGLCVRDKRIVVAGTGPLLLAVAAHLQQYGAYVVCIAEQASLQDTLAFGLSLWRQPGKLLQGLKYRVELDAVPYRAGCWPVAAHGEAQLESVTLTDGANTWNETCEYLACGFHLVPNTELAALLGCDVAEGHVAVGTHQQTSVEHIFCAGESSGIGGLDCARIEGEIAGLAAVDPVRVTPDLLRRGRRERRFAAALARAFRLRDELRCLPAGETVVCRCEDVPFSQLQHRRSWTEAKLQTRCGMGPCQGRICGPATEALFGWHAGAIRPPLFPIPVAAFCDESHQIQESLAGQEICR